MKGLFPSTRKERLYNVYAVDFYSKQLAAIEKTLNWILAVLIGIFLTIIF